MARYTQEMVNKLTPMKVRRLQLEGKISRAMLTAYCQYHNSKSK